MDRSTEVLSMRISFVFVFVLISAISFLMAEESTKSAGVFVPGSGEDGAVHIVYVDRPEGEDPEAFHIRTLASVVGGLGFLLFVLFY